MAARSLLAEDRKVGGSETLGVHRQPAILPFLGASWMEKPGPIGVVREEPTARG